MKKIIVAVCALFALSTVAAFADEHDAATHTDAHQTGFADQHK